MGRERIGRAILAVAGIVVAGFVASCGTPAVAETSTAAAKAFAGGAPTRTDAGVVSPFPSDCAQRSMNVVAHQDDDLLFINPSVSEDIAAGRCVLTVYVTAGDAGRPRSYWLGREKGARQAYAAMARTNQWWAEDRLAVNGKSAARFTLRGGRITLIFLRLPDANTIAGRPVDGMRRLWRGALTELRTVDDGQRYTRGGLLGTLTALMDAYLPDQIRTLDYAGRYGDGDHADHYTVGYFTEAAQRSYRFPHGLSGYLGYPVERQPVNLTDEARDAKLGYFLAYAPYDRKVCQTSAACLGNFYAPRFARSVRTATQ